MKTEKELKQAKLRKIIGRTFWILLSIFTIGLMTFEIIFWGIIPNDPHILWYFGSFGIGFTVGFPLVLLIDWFRNRSKPKDEAKGEMKENEN